MDDNEESGLSQWHAGVVMAPPLFGDSNCTTRIGRGRSSIRGSLGARVVEGDDFAESWNLYY